MSGIVLPEGITKEGSHYISLSDGAKMVLIPEGEFMMGVEEKDIFAKEHEKPQRQVYLSAYLIDIYPVINTQYKRFIEAGGYEQKSFWCQEGWDWKIKKEITHPLVWGKEGWNEPLQPVSGVSWYEAHAYARWAEKELPTEAQWEKAARGTDGLRYPWGEDLPTSKVANFNGKIGYTTPVDKYPEGISPYGCYDMSGNVNNWCRDWYWEDFYKHCKEYGLNRNPLLDDNLAITLGLKKELKVDRGGGFATSMRCCEVLSCTDKTPWFPWERNLWNGFRTVKAVP